MKAHEEDWDIYNDGVNKSIRTENCEPVATIHFCTDTETTKARALLAAQAPAMARLLLQLYDPENPNWTSVPSRRRVLSALRAAGVIP